MSTTEKILWEIERYGPLRERFTRLLIELVKKDADLQAAIYEAVSKKLRQRATDRSKHKGKAEKND